MVGKVFTLRVWFNGRTVASQASSEGSIPFTRFSCLLTTPSSGVLFPTEIPSLLRDVVRSKGGLVLGLHSIWLASVLLFIPLRIPSGNDDFLCSIR